MMSGSDSSDRKINHGTDYDPGKNNRQYDPGKNIALLNVDNKAIKRGRIIGVLVPVQRRRRRKNSVQT
jgi:hypothetical protein